MWSVIGTLLGLFFGYHFSKKIAETQAKHAKKLTFINARLMASVKLRAAFAFEMGQIETLGITGDWLTIDSTLTAALPKHSAAFHEYRWFVPIESQWDYQQAWEDYCKIFKGGGSEFFLTGDRTELFRERIEAILKFTEPF